MSESARNKIIKDTENFLSKGGVVNIIPTGLSGEINTGKPKLSLCGSRPKVHKIPNKVKGHHPLLTVQEMADKAGVTRQKIDRMIRQGLVKAQNKMPRLISVSEQKKVMEILNNEK